MRSLFTLLASLSSYLTLLVASIVCGLLALPARLLPQGWADGVLRLWARWWLAGSGLTVQAEVPEALGEPWRGDAGVVFLANHESWYDIPAILATVPGPVAFMAKKSLFAIPFFGWGLRAVGGIPIDRYDKRSAAGSLSNAGRALGEGISVVLFPEGTRCWDGELGELQRGGFLLALRAGAPVVPVGIHGTFRILPRTRWTVRPGPIRIRYGEPLETASYGLQGRSELMETVRERIQELSAC